MPSAVSRMVCLLAVGLIGGCDRLSMTFPSTRTDLPQASLAAVQENKPRPDEGPKPQEKPKTGEKPSPSAPSEKPLTTGAQAQATTTGSSSTLSAPSGPRTLRPEDFKGLPWRSIGPANMGGRLAAIAIAPGNPKMFFIGFGTGGLFKTANNGTTFSPLFDKEATASIGSIAIADAPADWPGWKDESAETEPATTKPDPEKEKNKGKAKIIWVGTGEGNGRNSSSYGNGVYRSTDGGSTFVNVGLNDSNDIPRLAVDPRSPDICYAAVMGHLWGPNKERGVFKTSDGGKTWT